MLKLVSIGTLLGLLFGGMTGGAVAGGWGLVFGAAIGGVIGAVVMGALWRVASGWTSAHRGPVPIECPMSHDAVTVHVRRDPETGRPLEVVGCTAFADASGVTCDRRCLPMIVAREMPPERPTPAE